MPTTIRKTKGRSELDAQHAILASLLMLMCFACTGAPAIGNGTTVGRLRTNASANGRVAGLDVTKASADNLWNLSGETATGAGVFRAYWLYIDAAGAASFEAGSDDTSIAAALAALPAHSETKSVWGVFVAGPSTNFALALAAQGTIYNGIPAGVPCGVPGSLYLAPARVNVVSA